MAKFDNRYVPTGQYEEMRDFRDAEREKATEARKAADQAHRDFMALAHLLDNKSVEEFYDKAVMNRLTDFMSEAKQREAIFRIAKDRKWKSMTVKERTDFLYAEQQKS